MRLPHSAPRSYALKLLGALLEFNRRWVADVAAAGLASRCGGCRRGWPGGRRTGRAAQPTSRPPRPPLLLRTRLHRPAPPKSSTDGRSAVLMLAPTACLPTALRAMHPPHSLLPSAASSSGCPSRTRTTTCTTCGCAAWWPTRACCRPRSWSACRRWTGCAACGWGSCLQGRDVCSDGGAVPVAGRSTCCRRALAAAPLSAQPISPPASRPRDTRPIPPCRQVLAVLGYAAENDVEPFLEPALHLVGALLADGGACTAGGGWCEAARGGSGSACLAAWSCVTRACAAALLAAPSHCVPLNPQPAPARPRRDAQGHRRAAAPAGTSGQRAA